MALNKLLYYTLCLILLTTNSTMIVFVVMEGQDLPNYQYAFAFVLAVTTTLAFYVWCVFSRIAEKGNFRFLYLNPFIALDTEVPRLHLFQISGIIGLCYAMNYTFLLLANPFTPGIIQVIFNELNIVVTMVGSFILLGKKYQILQIVAGCVCLIGGAIPLAKSSGTTAATSNIPSIVWYLIYMCGTIPIAISFVITENLVQIGIKSHIKSQAQVEQSVEDTEDLMAVNNGFPTSEPVVRTVRISQLYCLANLWTCVFTLSFFWVAGIAYQDDLWSNFGEGLKCIFTFCSPAREPGVGGPGGASWVWIASVFSWVSTWSSAMITREEDVTIATLLMTVAPFLSSAFMGIHPIFGNYYQETNWTTWLSLGIVALSVVMYKIPSFMGKGISYPYRNLMLIIQEPVMRP